MIKNFLVDQGLTVSQAITAIPVLLSLIGLMFRLIKIPFIVIDVISANKYVSLPLKDKIDAITIVYQEKESDNVADYINELKLAEYGLFYPISTLRIIFDYLHSKKMLSSGVHNYSILKHHSVFFIDCNSLPKISIKGVVFNISLLSAFFIVSFGGFLTGVRAIIDTLSNVSGWMLFIQLALYTITEIFFIVIMITMITEIISVFSAILFSRKLQGFNQKQLYRKYKVSET